MFVRVAHRKQNNNKMHTRRSAQTVSHYMSTRALFACLISITGNPLLLAQEPAEGLTDATISTEAAEVEPGTAPPAEPEFSDKEQFEDAQARFLGYFNDGLYQQALTAAEQTVRLATRIYGADSLETALTLINLANAQYRTNDLMAARQNYQASINLIEEHEGIVSPRLINPLMGLGATHNAIGDYDRGLRAYERALRVNHVELGLKNIEQMEIRDGMTESYIGLGDAEDANFQQETQARIIRDEYGDDLEKLLPAVYKLAEWYRRSGQPDKETLLLQNAVRTVKQAVGDDSTMQIKALRDMASAYQRMDMPAECLRALKRALRISKETEPADQLLTADILVEIGDFYNGFGDLRDARKYYLLAWEILETEQAIGAQEKYFATPVNIWSVQLPDVYPMNSKTKALYVEDPDRFINGQVLAQYDIDDFGRVDNITIIESDPTGLIDKRVRYLLTRYFYRPRIVAGEPLVTEAIALTHRFSYLPEKVAADETAKQGGSNGDSERLSYPGMDN